MKSWEAILYLENGHLLRGWGFGARKPSGGEIVFNTALAGYQEVISDPSYRRQIVVMTYPHLGNTGITKEDWESSQVHVAGIVAREYCDVPSNWRSVQTLGAALADAGTPGLAGVDTRRLTQVLREEGNQRAVIFPRELTNGADEAFAKTQLAKVPDMQGLELVSEVTCREPYEYKPTGPLTARYPATGRKILVYDFGVKTNLLEHFASRGFRPIVVPAGFSAEAARSEKPVAIALSSGPGDPEMVQSSVQAIGNLVGEVPIFAVCMGHQLLARALGAKTYKLKFGHHGVNHPVKDAANGRVVITSQNHGFCVDLAGLPPGRVEPSFVSLNDGTLEGCRSASLRFESVQFHPESNPGPRDGSYLFDQFIQRFLQ